MGRGRRCPRSERGVRRSEHTGAGPACCSGSSPASCSPPRAPVLPGAVGLSARRWLFEPCPRAVDEPRAPGAWRRCRRLGRRSPGSGSGALGVARSAAYRGLATTGPRGARRALPRRGGSARADHGVTARGRGCRCSRELHGCWIRARSSAGRSGLRSSSGDRGRRRDLAGRGGRCVLRSRARDLAGSPATGGRAGSGRFSRGATRQPRARSSGPVTGDIDPDSRARSRGAGGGSDRDRRSA